jgi:cellulose synthase/poly-beta-1,6-N-acetylglucosamine synthase-like glycosyltransferase
LRPVRLTTRESILAGLGIAKPAIRAAALRAEHHGTTIEAELIAAGSLREDLYYEAMADALSLKFIRQIDPRRVIVTPSVDALLKDPTRPLKLDSGDGRTVTVIAPRAEELEGLSRLMEKRPQLARSLAVAAPAGVRQAVWQVRAEERVERCRRQLFEERPQASARVVTTGWQGFFLALVLAGFAAAALHAPGATLLILHLVLTVTFTACMVLRLLAFFHRPVGRRNLLAADKGEAPPVYTVLVAMYQEAAVAHQLVAALDALRWPRSRLQIKLVCEANDRETIEALERLDLGPHYEIVRVPRVMPFTKPKALSYAMAGVSGDYVVIYDAEDRPHPEQLLEAHARFGAGDERLACVQAPLIIANGRRSWLASLFALEYAGLFRGLLPFLADAGLPLPLGGTSNHFRASILRKVGGWDPYNVTEDADLGLRLARDGYRFAVITRPTFEDAPTKVRDWFYQRSRWYKGWMQTWLVLMRRPLAAFREFGPLGFLSAQIVTAGMLLAALLSPFMAYFVLRNTLGPLLGLGFDRTMLDYTLVGIDLTVIVGTYAGFVGLGWKLMSFKERLHVGSRWLLLPFYWMLMCAAAWHAGFELVTRPFHWHKTPHQPSSASATGRSLSSEGAAKRRSLPR